MHIALYIRERRERKSMVGSFSWISAVSSPWLLSLAFFFLLCREPENGKIKYDLVYISLYRV